MASLNVRDLGDYIREQRRAAQISLRQLARQAGVSNPYLSQIERGLRKPSAEILQQIAKALRISAEVLYVQAGILEEHHGDSDVVAAISRDSLLTERQRQVILEIYEAFCRENAAAARSGADSDPVVDAVAVAAGSTRAGVATTPVTTTSVTTSSVSSDSVSADSVSAARAPSTPAAPAEASANGAPAPGRSAEPATDPTVGPSTGPTADPAAEPAGGKPRATSRKKA